jgi:hypothetical protein
LAARSKPETEFRYTQEQKNEIVESLGPLRDGVKRHDVIRWVTTAARSALRTERQRRPFAGKARKELEEYAGTLRNAGKALSLSVHRHLLRGVDKYIGQADDRRRSTEVLKKLKELNECPGIDFVNFHRVMSDVLAEIATKSSRDIGGAGFQRRGHPRDKARFDFGMTLYVIFREATGRKPTSYMRRFLYSSSRSCRRSLAPLFSLFVERAIEPVRILGAAGVESVVRDVVKWTNKPRSSQRDLWILRVRLAAERDLLRNS